MFNSYVTNYQRVRVQPGKMGRSIVDFIGPGDFVVNSTRPSEIGFLMDFIGPRDVIADFIGPGSETHLQQDI